MSREKDAGHIYFIESNTSGTGWLFMCKAKKLGLRPVLVTAHPERYKFLTSPEAPEMLEVTKSDRTEIERVMRDRRTSPIRGITSTSEYFISTAADLAQRLGLPGPNADTLHSVRNKHYQRQKLAEAGLHVPHFRRVRTEDEALLAAREFGFPVVLKPVGQSGSVGVRACTNEEQVRYHIRFSLSHLVDDDQSFLVESLVEGLEVSVEIFNGQVIGITRKYLCDRPYFVEVGHDFPAQLPHDTELRILDYVIKANTVLGLDWGPIHWELRVCEDRVCAIEVNPRLAGGFIPELIRQAQGIDLIEATLQLTIGVVPIIRARYRKAAVIRFILPSQEGTLDAFEGVDSARLYPYVTNIELYRSRGETLMKAGNFKDRIGHVIACARDRTVAIKAAEEAMKQVQVRIHGTNQFDNANSAGRTV